MTSWWRLRTQVFLVLAVLLSLIAFLGAYALSEARRYADEADDLLNTNVRAAAILKELETVHAEKLKMEAKFIATGDYAYRRLANKRHAAVLGSFERLDEVAGSSSELAAGVEKLRHSYRAKGTAFVRTLRGLERGLDAQRARRIDRIQVVVRDLARIIFVAFLVAIGVTTWLAAILYYAVLQPIERIKGATRRIREGELSCRAKTWLEFDELTALSREFNAMAGRIEELDKMKSDFLSTVSHELKTPLTALKEGLAFLAEKQGALPTPIFARTMEVCNQSAKRLETMIQNLLDHSRMESGFYHFDGRPKNFLTVIENAIQGIRPIAERKRQVIEFKVATPHHFASFSTDGITHVIENLLLNAIKYADSAHPIQLEVRTVDRMPVPELEVRVTNRGKGLLPGELTRVFDRFFRGLNSDGQKGVGIGLSVVKRIIEAHHGRVWAESANGVTTFSFRIPQRYESEPKQELRRIEGPVINTGGQLDV